MSDQTIVERYLTDKAFLSGILMVKGLVRNGIFREKGSGSVVGLASGIDGINSFATLDEAHDKVRERAKEKVRRIRVRLKKRDRLSKKEIASLERKLLKYEGICNCPSIIRVRDRT